MDSDDEDHLEEHPLLMGILELPRPSGLVDVERVSPVAANARGRGLDKRSRLRRLWGPALQGSLETTLAFASACNSAGAGFGITSAAGSGLTCAARMWRSHCCRDSKMSPQAEKSSSALA